MAFDLLADFELVNPQEGESIAVNGVCLTAYSIHGKNFSADVSPETLSRTGLGSLGQGDQVNLERALCLADRLGGHLVSGHVDCRAKVIGRKELGNYTLFFFELPKEQMRYVVEKGSITIDGVSLTVNSCEARRFSVSIIPHTLMVTTLGRLSVGSMVNIEVDIIGKYVEKLLMSKEDVRDGSEKKGGNSISHGFLAENGFL